MNKNRVKALLLRDKGFLKELYEGDNPIKNKRVIQTADDSELNTLIKFLHFLSNGEIKMKKENFQKIQAAHKLKLLTKSVEKKSKAMKLIQRPRKFKIKFLNQLLRLYPALLDCLFNEV